MASRLDLRPMTADDADELFAILADPAMWDYDPPRRHASIAETRSYVERAAGRWATDGLSYWTVRLAGTGEVMGSGGAQRHRGTFWNLNYRVATAHQGQGYAAELLAAALAAATAADPDAPRIAWIDEVNAPSRRVAERAGLVDRGLRWGAIDDVVRRAYADRPLDPERFPAADAPARAGEGRWRA